MHQTDLWEMGSRWFLLAFMLFDIFLIFLYSACGTFRNRRKLNISSFLKAIDAEGREQAKRLVWLGRHLGLGRWGALWGSGGTGVQETGRWAANPPSSLTNSSVTLTSSPPSVF